MNDAEDVAAASRELRILFDANRYLARYPDVRNLDLDPVEHYLRFGADEGREPCAHFDGPWYRTRYSDVAARGLNPLLHYIRHGAAELRDPNPRFDAAFYVDAHPEAVGNPLLYHLLHGAKLGWPTEPNYVSGALLPSHESPLSLPSDLTVDVVVPVYRGYAETVRCIESVLADAERPPGHLIVVDDWSPEPRLAAWLDRQAKRGRIVLARNPRNRGFVRSANLGISLAKHADVALLNSDTEVPQGWLARLAGAAYSADDIATVSPLSNNATICSYPDAPGGAMPDGMTLTQIDTAARAANAGRTVDLPTSVGSCMYIRRAAWDAVGPFDATAFGQGYGEEVDFCHRATAKGWRHVLACDVFIYHKGEVSFGTNSPAARKGQRALRKRYPDHARDIDTHVRIDPARPARFALTAALFRQNGLPGILFVTHRYGGGIQRHVQDLIGQLRGRANILLLAPGARGVSLSVPAITGHPVLPIPSNQRDELARYLESAAIQRVHIHHVMEIDLDLYALIQRLGVPFDLTLHDYFAICPQINLLPFLDAQYCREPEERYCNACIAANPKATATDIDTWRRSYAWLLRDADRVICPSEDAKARLLRHGLGDKAVVAPHEPVAATAWPQPTIRLSRGEKLRIALIGTLADRKGLPTVAEVAAALDAKPDNWVELLLIGHAERTLDPALAKRLTVTGSYEEADLAALLARLRPHAFWFPAQWPETYSYTLSAAIAAGGAIIATDLGAFRERLRERPLTWLVSPGAPASAWLDSFAAAQRSLEAKSGYHQMGTRTPIADFYATEYLRPLSQSDPRPARSRRSRTRTRIFLVPEQLDNGRYSPCAYIRLLQPLHHPDIAKGHDTQCGNAVAALRETPDLIVTHRHAIADDETAKALLAHCRRHDIRLVYDLDDDLLDVPPEHPEADRLSQLAGTVAYLAAKADAVWVSTQRLAARVGRPRRKTLVLPNCLDERLWWPPQAVDLPPAGPTRLLYMGTRTHAADLDLILPALNRLCAEFGDRVAIDVIGVSPHHLPAGLNRVEVPYPASQTYPAFVNWLSRQNRWHIGLAPLVDTAFNRGKSAIKAMDYAALGLPCVASDVGVFTATIESGVNGLLVENTEAAWFAALAGLLRDPHRCHALARAARTGFSTRFTLAGQAAVWRNALATQRP